jgi:hypothetical protein
MGSNSTKEQAAEDVTSTPIKSVTTTDHIPTESQTFSTSLDYDTNDGYPMNEACRQGNINLVKLLVQKGFNPDEQVTLANSSRVEVRSHPLIMAVQSGNFVLVHYLIEELKVDPFNSRYYSLQDGRHHTRQVEYDAICAAIDSFHSRTFLLEYLIDKAHTAGNLSKSVAYYLYGDTSTEKLPAMTYLHYAAFRKNVAAMELLVRHGSDPNIILEADQNVHVTYCSVTKGPPTPMQIYPELKNIVEKSKGDIDII